MHVDERRRAEEVGVRAERHDRPSVDVDPPGVGQHVGDRQPAAERVDVVVEHSHGDGLALVRRHLRRRCACGGGASGGVTVSCTVAVADWPAASVTVTSNESVRSAPSMGADGHDARRRG